MLKALAGFLILQEMGRYKLECDWTLELRVLSFIHHADPSFAEFLGGLVMGDRLADHEAQILPLPDNW